MEETTEEDSGIWLSIGDLMSALLMVFVLLCLVSLLNLQDMREKYEAKVEQLQELLKRKESKRIMVIKSLTDALDAANIEATLDQETGDLSISNEILFEQGKSKSIVRNKLFSVMDLIYNRQFFQLDVVLF